MTHTPADELRDATTLLRRVALDALRVSPLPWQTTGEHVIRCGNNERGIVVDSSSEPGEAGDLPFIATMHPGVGLALADWLDAAADYYVPGPAHPTHVAHALAVARQILGTTGEQPAVPQPEPADRAAQETEAHRTLTEWIGEVQEGDGFWMYLGANPDRAVIEKRIASHEKRFPSWADGTPVRRRIVRKTTTYTTGDPS